jgi:hypothetical protein
MYSFDPATVNIELLHPFVDPMGEHSVGQRLDPTPKTTSNTRH